MGGKSGGMPFRLENIASRERREKLGQGLAKAILEGLSATKSKPRAVRKMTVSGGAIH